MDNKDIKTKKENSADSDTENTAKPSNIGSKTSKKDEVELLKQRIEELENQNKRLLADYRNLEKRAESERREWALEANRSLLLNLLPILDTLILVDKHSQHKDRDVGLSIQQFLDILKKEGVEKIETKGKNFDPNLMECIEIVEGEEGKVAEETRAGYTLYGKTLKPSLVRVGSAKQNQEKGN